MALCFVCKNEDLRWLLRHSGPLVSEWSYYAHHNSSHIHTHGHTLASSEVPLLHSSIAIQRLLPSGPLWLPEQLLGCAATRSTSLLNSPCIFKRPVIKSKSRQTAGGQTWHQHLHSTQWFQTGRAGGKPTCKWKILCGSQGWTPVTRKTAAQWLFNSLDFER